MREYNLFNLGHQMVGDYCLYVLQNICYPSKRRVIQTISFGATELTLRQDFAIYFPRESTEDTFS